MGILDQILSAVNNSNQAGTTGQMASILSTVQQVSDSYGAEPSTVQSAMSIVGNYVRSALQQKRDTDGYDQAQELVNQYSGSYPNPQAVHSLFSTNQIEGVVEAVAQRTGLNPGLVQQMLPILVPLVLNLLQTGTQSQNPQGGNPVLNAFLDADRDGDVDIVDAMQMAARYLGH
jgi:hypothetical protein